MHHWTLSFVIHAAIVTGVVFVLSSDSPRPQSAPETIPVEGLSPHKNAVKRAVETTAAAPATSEGSAPSSAEIQAYLRDIAQRIERLKRYPEEARLKEQEGVVEVGLEIGPDGGLLHTSIQKSSGFESLDQAALRAVQALGKLPVPPQSPIRLQIPVQFQLQ